MVVTAGAGHLRSESSNRLHSVGTTPVVTDFYQPNISYMNKGSSAFPGNAPGIRRHGVADHHAYALASTQEHLDRANPLSGACKKRHHGMAGHSKAAGQHSAHSFGDPSSSMGVSDMATAGHYSITPGQSLDWPPQTSSYSSATGGSSPLLYSTYRNEHGYAAMQLTVSQPASQQQHAVADTQHISLQEHAVRAQQEQLLRQQQQLMLQQYKMEAAAAAQAAVLQQQQQQQQQAGGTHAAAMASSSSQASQQVTIPLYGNYSRTAVQQPRYWTGAAAPAPASWSMYATCHAAAVAGLQQQQQHKQVAVTAAGRPPWPPHAASSSSQQQNDAPWTAAAAAAADASPAGHDWAVRGAVNRCSTHMPPHHHHQQQQQQQLLADQRSLLSGSTGGARPVTALAVPVPVQYDGPSASGGQADRWSGQLACLEVQAVGGSQTSEGRSGHMLECDEDLFSIGTGEGRLHQSNSSGSSTRAAAHADVISRGCGRDAQRHMYSFHVEMAQVGMELQADLQHLTEASGSTKGDGEDQDDDMEQDQDIDDFPCTDIAHGSKHVGGFDSTALVAAKAAAAAAQQAAQALPSVELQVLGRVAALRQGYSAVNASPTAAAAAGAQSVRSRLLITEVSLYADQAANSQMALDQANKLLCRMRLPDGTTFMPVSPHSFLFKAGAAWQFPAFVICLGSSYLQRMLVRLPQLSEAVLACPGFEDYAQHLPDHVKPLMPPPRLSGPEAVATLATLRSVQFTCMYIATKVADQIHALGLLRFMLTNLSQNGAVVSLQQAANVEACCLDALDWRLGPFFLEDELSDNDEELWATSMGHWDYGTIRDAYPGHY